MSTLFQDLKMRILATSAATSIGEFNCLVREIEQSNYTPDERGELDELLAEAFVNAKSSSERGVGSAENKPASA
jgi:hypothetical protein